MPCSVGHLAETLLTRQVGPRPRGQRHDEAASSLPTGGFRPVWGTGPSGHSPAGSGTPQEEGLCSRSVSIFYLFESGTGSSFKVSLK